MHRPVAPSRGVEDGLAYNRTLVIASQDGSPQQVESLFRTYKGVVERNGGRLEEIEMAGVKSLAYRIEKNGKAHVALLALDAPPAAVAEMEHQMQIPEDVLRFMTIRVEDLDPEAPSHGLDGHGDSGNAPRRLQAELDAYSRDILRELRRLNDDIEVKFRDAV